MNSPSSEVISDSRRAEAAIHQGIEGSAELEALYHRLNPLELQRDLEAALERLWTLAAADPHRAMEDASGASHTMNSVTVINELTAFGG